MPDAKRKPEFANPPVAEVALSAQFAPLAGLHAAHMGILWSLFRDQFPNTEEQLPLPRIMERFEKPEPPVLKFQVEPAPLVPRCWFFNPDGSQLIQIQNDRLIHNWRKLANPATYPRYRNLRTAFERNLRMFEEFVNREGLGTFRPDQCELTYIDHIEPGTQWKNFDDAHRVFRVWGEPAKDYLDLPSESVTFDVKYVLPGSDGKAVGRLHVTAKPVYRLSDRMPMFLMTSVGRGAPLGDGVEGVLRFLDVAHDWIVRAFMAVTTDAMHAQWGLRNA